MGRIKRSKHGPEWYIQRDLVTFLRERNWLVERMIGNAYQKGIPDLYCFREDHGPRWLDVKAPGRYTFTREQKIKWPIWHHYGVGIWILTAATQEQYDKLFAKPNWKDYWKPEWGTIPNIDELLDQITDDDEASDETE
jgi:hypothetical protein